MIDVQYARGFSDALDYVAAMFNKLMLKEKLKESCKNCIFIEEIGKLAIYAKDKQFEKIEQELGYYLT